MINGVGTNVNAIIIKKSHSEIPVAGQPDFFYSAWMTQPVLVISGQLTFFHNRIASLRLTVNRLVCNDKNYRQYFGHLVSFLRIYSQQVSKTC